MKALKIVDQHKVEVVDVDDPRPGPGEVRIAMKAAGICGSDLHAYRATMHPDLPPTARMTPGHEPSGLIDELGPGVEQWSVGDAVTAHASRGCGTCDECRRGSNASCAARKKSGLDVDGSDAEFMVLPARNLVRLPASATFVEGMLYACNVGTAFQAAQRLNPRAGETVVVFGAGPVGCAVTMIAKARGARVIVVEPSKPRLEFAASLGADQTVQPGDAGPVQVIMDLTRGRGADAAVECSGSPAAQQAALESLAYWARAVFVGMNQQSLALDAKAQLIERQLTLIGSTMWPLTNFAVMTRFIEEHGIDIERLVSHRTSIEAGQSAFETANQPAFAGKIAFTFA